MRNPWLDIPLADYEGHMALPAIGQSRLIADQLDTLVSATRSGGRAQTAGKESWICPGTLLDGSSGGGKQFVVDQFRLCPDMPEDERRVPSAGAHCAAAAGKTIPQPLPLTRRA
jgi:hypothetical protein